MLTQDQLKKAVAQAALAEIEPNTLIGIGTGSTVNFFIDALRTYPHPILGTIASSKATEKRLKEAQLPVVNINEGQMSLYIDGADECNTHKQLVKGGGGALTGEKILAAVAKRFICLIDEAKAVKKLGTFPLAIEVIPLARSFVAREIVKLGGDPVYREGFITDHGNQILDVYHLDITQPIALEETLNNITGVVCNGLFAKRAADKVLIATQQGIDSY